MKTIKFIKKALAVASIICALSISSCDEPTTIELVSSVAMVFLSMLVFIEESLNKYY